MPSLDQIIACHRIDGKPSSEPNMFYCQLDGPIGTMNCEPNAAIFIQENDIENIIWTISSILTRPPCDSGAELTTICRGYFYLSNTIDSKQRWAVVQCVSNHRQTTKNNLFDVWSSTKIKPIWFLWVCGAFFVTHVYATFRPTTHTSYSEIMIFWRAGSYVSVHKFHQLFSGKMPPQLNIIKIIGTHAFMALDNSAVSYWCDIIFTRTN